MRTARSRSLVPGHSSALSATLTVAYLFPHSAPTPQPTQLQPRHTPHASATICGLELSNVSVGEEGKGKSKGGRGRREKGAGLSLLSSTSSPIVFPPFQPASPPSCPPTIPYAPPTFPPFLTRSLLCCASLFLLLLALCALVLACSRARVLVCLCACVPVLVCVRMRVCDVIL